MKRIYNQRMIKRRIKNQKGFTLLELILAMSIVAIIVALGLGGVRLGIAARDVGEQKVDIYQRLRIISEQLKQKLQSTYPVFVSQINGVPGTTASLSSKKILAFEGNTDSIRFVTFGTPMSASDPKTLMQEVKFYIGKHPETGQNGFILMERDISNGDTFSKIEPRSNSIKYYVMAENIAQLKFRYYQVKKTPLNELDRLNKKPLEFFGQWNDSISMLPLKQSQGSPRQANLVLNFEKTNKISLPRAVEITIGINPEPKPGEKVAENKLKTIFSPPIIVLLNSGMEFALPQMKREADNENA
jgi:prepilin-type N-terminal cleavage/methylation domain-containing protein